MQCPVLQPGGVINIPGTNSSYPEIPGNSTLRVLKGDKMRLNRVSLASTGVAIIETDHMVDASYKCNIMLYGSNGINATAQVDGSISELTIPIPVSVSRSGTTVTVTFPSTNPHTLGGTSDYIIISGTGVSSLDGTYSLASVTNTTVLTYTSGTSATTTAVGYAVPIRLNQSVIASAAVSATSPAVPAATAVGTYYETTPFSCLILKCTAWVAGTVYLDVRQAGLR